MFKEEEYQKKVQELEDEISILKEKLKSYTAPLRNKKFYENHKEELKQKSKEYKENISVEKKKEYARRAYLKKKEKSNAGIKEEMTL
jgi:hypothetical protein